MAQLHAVVRFLLTPPRPRNVPRQQKKPRIRHALSRCWIMSSIPYHTMSGLSQPQVRWKVSSFWASILKYDKKYYLAWAGIQEDLCNM